MFEGRRKILGMMAGSMLMATAGIAQASDGDMASVEGIEDGAWAVMAGATLKSTLEGWSRHEGWNVVWDNPSDYRIRASVTFYGDFESAVGRLVDAIYQENAELSVTLYRGNRVIHVDESAIANN